ncbi:MAG: hypothetical protein ACR2Q3_01670 [Woeseiaceae bacterium]
MTCKINGCPLRAEFITDYDDDGKAKWGMCRYHRMTDPSSWKQTTARINEYAKTLLLFAQIDQLEDPILLALPGEDVPTWINRVRDNLRRVITGTYHNQTDGEANFAELYHALGKENMNNGKT